MTEPPHTPEDAPAQDELGPETFRADLLHQREARFSKLQRLLIATGLSGLLLLVIAAANVWAYFISDLPEVPKSAASLVNVNAAPGMTFLDRNGRLIATRGPKHGLKVRLTDLPRYVPLAFVAAEDRRFYDHGGVDWRAVIRAQTANTQAGRVVQGGSTISQQLARNLFLSPRQHLKRKVQEMILAEQLMNRLGHDGVLELYLNRVYFGRGAYGIDAAAQAHFGKPAKSLNLAEAAILAGVLKSPSHYNPSRYFDRAMHRAGLVLDNMVAEGWITREQARAARAQQVVIAPGRTEGDFSWVIDMAAEEARQRAPGEADLVVRLTIDPALQTAAASALRETLNTEGKRLDASQGAVVVLAPDGAIRALVGGRDPALGPFNRATQANRQPGSAFKPFVWAAALESGVGAEDRISTERVAMGPYTPDSQRAPPQMALEQALAMSNNAVAVRLAREVGTARVAELARRFGLQSAPQKPHLSIALGAYETTLLELTGAYQPFQQGGRHTARPWLVAQVLGSDGRIIWEHRPTPPSMVYDSSRAGAMVRMMTAVIERGTGRRASFGRPAAGKTGTSQKNRDAWFVGFTPDWLAGVWIGNDDNRPMRGVEGGTLPADVWRKVMIAAHGDLPVRGFDAQTAEGVILAPAPDTATSTDIGMEATQAVDRENFYRTLAAEFDKAARE